MELKKYMSEFLAIIPARYGSTRFPGKPLARLGGKCIVQHVYDRVSEVFRHTYVATDDERIMDAVVGAGGRAVMTRSDHQSGTDRCWEAYEIVSRDAAMPRFDVVVNVQGDEPFIAKSQLLSLCGLFEDASTDIATLVQPFSSDASWETLSNPNSPKVVTGRRGEALYFSRSVIPFLRGVDDRDTWASRHQFLRHIGLYAYTVAALQRVAHMPKGNLEGCESLEQLRWLEEGLKIRVARTDAQTIGIDTPADLEKAAEYLQSGKLI